MKKYLLVITACMCSLMMIACGKQEATVETDEVAVLLEELENQETETQETENSEIKEQVIENNDVVVTASTEEQSKYVSDEEITRLSTEKYGENSRLKYIYYDLTWDDLDPESDAMSAYVAYIWYYKNLGYDIGKYFEKYPTCAEAITAINNDVTTALDVTVNRQALAAKNDGGDVVGSDFCVYYYHGSKAGKGHSYKMDPRTKEITYASPENPNIAKSGSPEAAWLEKMGYHTLCTGLATGPFMDKAYAEKYPWPFSNDTWNYETHQWEKIE